MIRSDYNLEDAKKENTLESFFNAYDFFISCLCFGT